MSQQKDISLLELCLRIFSNGLIHWKLISALVIIPTAIVFVCVVWVIEPEYEISAVVTPPQEKDGMSSGNIKNIISDFADMKVPSLISNNNGEDIVWTYFNSWELHKKVVEKFDFYHRYKFDKKSKYFAADLLKTFRKNMKIDNNDESMIEISFRDKDYSVAKQVLDYMIYEVDSMYQAYKTNQASQSRHYLDVRIAEVNSNLDSLQKEFVEFQSKNGYYDPEVQLESSLKYYSQRQVERDAVIAEMMYEKNRNGTDSKRYEELKKQLKSIDESISMAVDKRKSNSGLVDLKKAPGLGAKYMRLETEIKVQQANFVMLRQQNEQLRFEEVNMQKNLIILQPPWENDKKVYPRRSLFLLFSCFVTFIIGLLISNFIEYIKKECAEDSSIGREWNFFVKKLAFWHK